MVLVIIAAGHTLGSHSCLSAYEQNLSTCTTGAYHFQLEGTYRPRFTISPQKRFIKGQQCPVDFKPNFDHFTCDSAKCAKDWLVQTVPSVPDWKTTFMLLLRWRVKLQPPSFWWNGASRCESDKVCCYQNLQNHSPQQTTGVVQHTQENKAAQGEQLTPDLSRSLNFHEH
jgi:hypothetical protein